MRRRARDQPPNAEPSKNKPTNAEEEKNHCSDGEEYSIKCSISYQQTPLATVLRKVMKYRGVNPPTTESSKGRHPCWGENTVGEDYEVSTNTLLREQP
jgi:hypothetical protein